ncbi:MAG: 4-(cytidine 5'-diphospho)-2-C-methyl-D-erythritol kinase [Erysipelotrichaceae bacterium]|nr:4-(cytidine 5'-diphospho)-2-C-methyl-D-erythritol kinase [Erysipelotrichaceae bacterium]
MKIEAKGKVNLSLDILGILPNGYHELDMIMAEIDLADILEIAPAEHDEIVCEGMSLPENNTLSKALKVLREKGGLKGCYKIAVEKNIPSQAGLGGGSADAAALMKYLNTVEGLNLSTADLLELGALVGADVPFCILQGIARVRGIGEDCQPIHSAWKFPVLLVQPDQGMSTPEAFKAWDKEEWKPLDIDIVQDAVVKRDPGLLYQTMSNALEPVAYEKLPVLGQIKEDMNACGLVRVMMTGSGSCMMGFCIEEKLIDEAEKALQGRYPFVKKVWVGTEEA